MGPRGQRPDFVRNNRKPTSMITRPGGFNCSVKGQQVCLLGDRLNNLKHTANGGAGLFEPLYGLSGCFDLVRKQGDFIDTLLNR